jgi:glycosyltransferase involved in cell wall biosynthesis
LRILYFTRDYTTHDHRFLSALARTEHQVYYLRLERRGIQLEDRPLPAQIEQIPWAGGQSPAHLVDGPRLLLDLKRVIRKVKPNLIQAGPLQRSAFLAALTGFQPLVSMSWGYDLIHDAQRNAWWRGATRFTLRRSDALVADSQIIRQLAIAHGMPAERIVTFPWGIDLKHFSPAKRAETPLETPGNPPPFTLLSTRNWEPVYGVEVIAHAFVQAARQRPELRLVMLGNGSLAGQLRTIFLRGGAMGEGDANCRVFLPGLVSQADLPRYYRSADLYVAATHSDGTSISLLEALACGLPALVSDIPGNREWITPGEQGWLFPEGDVQALAQAMVRAVDQRDRLAEMGRHARQLAEQRADWEQNFPKLLLAYDIALHAVRKFPNRPTDDR